ncbi:MAG: 16S rRNA (cytidine(1402)-2'-O)-methyltransferase [Paracoccaceae bacterium]|nr:16S rRNA (cytidine(1402)-2'-O)-methyltransferase [Paracoccaceae bacterium]
MLDPGLYMVATPIGNARDITLRALDILTRADAIAAEDTRQTRKLMGIHGIALAGRPIVSYHDGNGPQRRPQILEWLRQGLSVAYCSDAGTPMIADPGFRLVEAALDAEFCVVAVPGASAILSALSVAGLPTDRFLFAGFLPPRPGPRRKALAELAAVPATLVFYESPRRVPAVLADMAAVLGGVRLAAVSRELTKRFEETRRGTLAELAEAAEAAGAPKGEVVIVVGPPERHAALDPEALDAALSVAMAEASVKDAARAVAERLGLPRREVYARALELAGR